MIRTFFTRPFQETKRESSNTILKRRTEHAVEDRRITQTQEGAHVKIEDQRHADCIFSPEKFGSSTICA